MFGAPGGIRVQNRFLAGQKRFPSRIRVLRRQCAWDEGEAAVRAGFGEGREEKCGGEVGAAEGARQRDGGAFRRPKDGRRQRRPEEERRLEGGHGG